MPLKRLSILMLVATLAFSLDGCGAKDGSSLGVAVVGSRGDPFASDYAASQAGLLVRASTAEGLVAFDEQGRVIPALADRWIVTDDGRSYIFRLRDGNWSNGDPITARSARIALQAALHKVASKPLGRDLTAISEVRAMASRVIEIRLTRASPYLLQVLAQPELGLLHDDRGSGPMTMVRTGSVAVLSPVEPSKLGQPEVQDWASRTRSLDLVALPADKAVDRFNQGYVDLVLGGRIQDFPLTRSVGILRGTIQIDPAVGLFGLQVMDETGFLATPEDREALAMAIDRGKLMGGFGVGGWQPSNRVVGQGLSGDPGTIGERWTQLSMDQRRQIAARRVQAWVQANAGAKAGGSDKGKSKAPSSLRTVSHQSASGAKAAGTSADANTGSALPGDAVGASAPLPDGPVVKIWLPAGPGSDLLYEGLAADFSAIGVTLKRTDSKASADLGLVDDVARYPQAQWFLDRLSCKSLQPVCSPQADALVAQADAASDPAQHDALMSEAESQLTAANVYIPFGAPIRWSLVRGSVDGFSANAWAWHPLLPLAWLPK